MNWKIRNSKQHKLLFGCLRSLCKKIWFFFYFYILEGEVISNMYNQGVIHRVNKVTERYGLPSAFTTFEELPWDKFSWKQTNKISLWDKRAKISIKIVKFHFLKCLNCKTWHSPSWLEYSPLLYTYLKLGSSIFKMYLARLRTLLEKDLFLFTWFLILAGLDGT